MNDPAAFLALASSGTLALGVFSVAALRGWHGWLELRRMQIGTGGGRSAPARVELADLRARVRRLEAIANGTDS